MRPYLLDSTVLIALSWPPHVHHRLAQDWFARRRTSGFRTCPLTQLAFVRISSNPTLTPRAVSPMQALDLLNRITALPEHGFWPDDLTLQEALHVHQPILGHRQYTDAYLLALAAAHGGLLATLDRGVLALPGATPDAVELLSEG
ncbi:MAG: VapC toxin family PIN domain ribonuclease [Acidobacteria bacterium]|nr:VapC toxin family PIN domain ribonuclease [Acidobacteriota bacterium]